MSFILWLNPGNKPKNLGPYDPSQKSLSERLLGQS